MLEPKGRKSREKSRKRSVTWGWAGSGFGHTTHHYTMSSCAHHTASYLRTLIWRANTSYISYRRTTKSPPASEVACFHAALRGKTFTAPKPESCSSPHRRLPDRKPNPEPYFHAYILVCRRFATFRNTKAPTCRDRPHLHCCNAILGQSSCRELQQSTKHSLKPQTQGPHGPHYH